MGENETHRRLLRVTVKQQFLVLHDKLIGTDVIRGRFFSANLAIYHFSLAVHGEVARMGLRCRDRIQVTDIIVFACGELHCPDDVRIFFLEHCGVFSVDRLSCCVIFAVVGDLIDKE